LAESPRKLLNSDEALSIWHQGMKNWRIFQISNPGINELAGEFQTLTPLNAVV
jgi:hypothetical protein